MNTTNISATKDLPLYLQNLPALPLNDKERIEALLGYCILDTAPEKEYDDITLLASEICQAPISSIGFIDEHRQVLKSNRGLTDVSARETTFCNHVISSDEDIFVINDSRKDERFVDHPAVVNDPKVIFYAGISLVTRDGYALGTLCVVDNKPRELTKQQRILLKALANQVVKLLELRKSNMALLAVTKQLSERANELDYVNKELDSFSYTVSHDLQAPLRTISGFAKILSKTYGDKLDVNGMELVNMIDGNVVHMNQLIQDLLKFSKSGKAPLVKAEVDMKQLATEVIHQIKLEKGEVKAEIIWQELKTAQCDRGLMKQVWANLLCNAFKYSSKNESAVVEIGMKKINDETFYYVKDNGAGFDMTYCAPKLFGVFQRMHTAEEFEGTGVGLATVQRIVNRHGGRIFAEAKPNEGAAFYFTIPSS